MSSCALVCESCDPLTPPRRWKDPGQRVQSRRRRRESPRGDDDAGGRVGVAAADRVDDDDDDDDIFLKLDDRHLPGER